MKVVKAKSILGDMKDMKTCEIHNKIKGSGQNKKDQVIKKDDLLV